MYNYNHIYPLEVIFSNLEKQKDRDWKKYPFSQKCFDDVIKRINTVEAYKLLALGISGISKGD